MASANGAASASRPPVPATGTSPGSLPADRLGSRAGADRGGGRRPAEAPQDQDRDADAGIAQRDPFTQRGDGEAFDPMADQGAAHLDRSMAIGVRLDHRDHLATAPRALAELRQVPDQG